MARNTPRWTLIALGVAVLWTCAGSAFAHFPVSRGVALTPSGSAAVALPGFGIVMRRDAANPFSYVCDGLLGVVQSDTAPAMSFAADGSLLIGSGSGLRSVDANGCPRADFGGALKSQPITGIEVHPALPNVVYAVTSADLPRVWRSSDGGVTWEQRASLVALSPVTALVLDPSDPEAVYVSQATPGGGGLLHVSKDGGTTFSKITQQAGLVLLDVESAAGDAGTARWWAVGRSATAINNQGFSLFDAASPSGPWSPLVDVRFFGGFARDPAGALWIGDEAGGVYRSTDDGGSFVDVSSSTAVSCLHFSQGTVWGCTPGIAQQNTLETWNDANQAFEGVIALSHVTRLASCGAETDVATKCAAAWVEWQRDILMLPQTPREAGATPVGTGGAPSGTGGSPAVPPVGGSGGSAVLPVPQPDASTPVPGARDSSSGCSITTRTPGPSLGIFALGALCCVATGRRFRRPR